MTTIETTATTAETTTPEPDTMAAAEALTGRFFLAALGAAELFTIHLGRAHGLWQAIDHAGSTTAVELADATGVDLRYLVEWLQSQAISGLLDIDGTDVWTARYSLALGVHEALIEVTNPCFAGGIPTIPVAVGRAYPLLEKAFRTGAGVAYTDYGPEAVSAQEQLNRPAYANFLVSDWMQALPDIHAKLTTGASVADLGTGAGWSAIELAKAYPNVRVDGYDDDEDSIARARRNAAEHGVAARVDFEVRDMTAVSANGPAYDFVTFFECVHDLAHPVEALRAARESLRPGGTVLVMDENIADTVETPGDEVQRFFAAASVVWCTPQGRVDETSEVVGTIMRPAKLRELAELAGFSSVDILPIEHPFWKFYRLNP